MNGWIQQYGDRQETDLRICIDSNQFSFGLSGSDAASETVYFYRAWKR